MTLNMKRIRAQLEQIAAEDETLDEEEDEAQPGQETIPQGGSTWASWLKWGIFLLIVVFLVWYMWLSSTGQAEEAQQISQMPEPQKPEPPPQPSPKAEPSRNGTFAPGDQSAAPFSLPEPPPNETTTHIWPPENW